MKSRRFLVIGGLSVLAGTAIGWSVLRGTGSPDVPTVTVHTGTFVRRVTAEGNLEAVESVPLGAPMSGRRPFKIAWMIEDGSRVRKGDVVVRFDATDFEEERDEGRSALEIAGFKLSKAQTQRERTIADLERDAGLAREEAEAARTYRNTDDTIFSRNEIIESEIDTVLAEKRADHAEAAREVEDRLAKAGIELLEIERQKVELKIRRAEEGLESLTLLAPCDGIVTFQRDWRGNIPHVGEQVWPGRPLASMPRVEAMQAVVYVLEADAGGLATGQRAEVTLEAYPDRVFPAKVAGVDPVAQQRIRRVPVQYFRTVLELEETVTELMKPGGRIHAEIFIAEEDQVITVPRQAVVDSEGCATVFRLEGRRFVPAEVETGASAGGRVVIVSGLSDGDVIALRDPTVGDREATPVAGNGPAGSMP